MEIIKIIMVLIGCLAIPGIYLSYYYFILDWHNKKIRDTGVKILGFSPLGYIICLAFSRFDGMTEIEMMKLVVHTMIEKGMIIETNKINDKRKS